MLQTKKSLLLYTIGFNYFVYQLADMPLEASSTPPLQSKILNDFDVFKILNEVM